MPRFHRYVRALKFTILFSDVNLIGNCSLLGVALVINGSFRHVWLYILEIAKMAAACTTFAHAAVRIVMAKVGIEELPSRLGEIILVIVNTVRISV